MKKKVSALLAGALSAAALITSVSAAKMPASVTTSPWAREEVVKAVDQGVFNAWLAEKGDYTAPISRDHFFATAISYVAAQTHFDSYTLSIMVRTFLSEKDPDTGLPATPFTDEHPASAYGSLNPYSYTAYYLNIATGNEKGEYNGTATITRQEAATILIRAYQACGGELPAEMADITYTDADDIQDWAKEGASALAVWDVMKGDQDGNFLPNELCTYEQAALMFLRLYENAPVSRLKGTVEPMFTYEQCMEGLESYSSFGCGFVDKLEGETVTFVDWGPQGFMNSHTDFYFVYRTGSVHDFDIEVNGTTYYPLLENTRFSEDEQTFYATFTKAADDISSPMAGLEPGTYQVTVDVDSTKVEVVKV